MSITVEVRGGNLEKALRVLKKKSQKAGILKELRERQYYQKPSFKKREARKARAKLIAKAQKKLDENLGYTWVKGEKIKRI